MNDFWGRWKKLYLVNLREYQKIKHSNKHQQIVNVKDIVIVQEEKMSQSAWKVGIVKEVIKGTDGNIWGVVGRVPRTKSLIKRAANKLHLIRGLKWTVLGGVCKIFSGLSTKCIIFCFLIWSL